MAGNFVIGLDFGTDSVRALVVNADTGEELGSGVVYYPRWKKQLYCDATVSRFRQHPADYLESMQGAVRMAVDSLDRNSVEHIRGIAVDTTGSTPVAVNEAGIPLALLPAFAEEPDAMFILWKDHTAQDEADEINRLSHRWKTDFTRYSGGLYSPEWFWSKILHIHRTNARVKEAAFSWMEHCDWIPALLSGYTDPLTIRRSRCAAGHKAMWHPDFDGLPSEEFLNSLEPGLGELRKHLYTETATSDEVAGYLCKEWADKLGLPEGIAVAVGALDAHMGAAGACIDAYTMVKVTGTSTCDMVVVPIKKYENHLVKGICGQVDGSVLPGMLGLEAGQSAFGDVYNWFAGLLSFPIREAAPGLLTDEQAEALQAGILSRLNERASGLALTPDDPVAVDWINGRRTPDVDLSLTGAIAGLHLGTDSAAIFKALVEATAFGARAILQRFEDEGIPVNKVIAIGGISRKSSFVMQTLCNVLNRPIAVVRSEQTCALGAAMFAAVAGGIWNTVKDAQEGMGSGVEKEYLPEPGKVKIYDQLFLRYQQLGQYLAAV